MKLFRTDYPLTPSFELVNLSIKLLRQHIWPVFYLMFLPALVVSVGLFMSDYQALLSNTPITWTNESTTGMILLGIGVLLSAITLPGSLIMQLDAVRGGTPEAFDSFKRGLRYILPYIGMAILLELAVIAGMIAFIIPGLFLIRSFYLSKYYIVDQKLGPIQSLKQSRIDSKPNAGYIWGIIGVTILFSFLGGILQAIPVIGYILTLVVSLLYAFAPAIRYNEIKNLHVADSIKKSTKVTKG